jgi:hypothetical protein
MVGLEVGIPETGGTGVPENGMVVQEIGIPETGGTGVPENGMVVLETWAVVREVGVPDTGWWDWWTGERDGRGRKGGN